MRAATAAAPDRVVDEPAPVPGRRTVLREVARATRPLVEIRTTRTAIALLDGWIACARARLREIVRLQEALFWSEHRANGEYFRAELYAAQLRLAGITPADHGGKPE